MVVKVTVPRLSCGANGHNTTHTVNDNGAYDHLTSCAIVRDNTLILIPDKLILDPTSEHPYFGPR